ncbi:hypothetical protein FB451DRAFT_142866 [Mycena latifolia]|nr:hypothetical protein FB451DRAFT_142866 [Mycena latifolia]
MSSPRAQTELPNSTSCFADLIKAEDLPLEAAAAIAGVSPPDASHSPRPVFRIRREEEATRKALRKAILGETRRILDKVSADAAAVRVDAAAVRVDAAAVRIDAAAVRVDAAAVRVDAAAARADAAEAKAQFVQLARQIARDRRTRIRAIQSRIARLQTSLQKLEKVLRWEIVNRIVQAIDWKVKLTLSLDERETLRRSKFD